MLYRISRIRKETIRIKRRGIYLRFFSKEEEEEEKNSILLKSKWRLFCFSYHSSKFSSPFFFHSSL